MSLVLVVTYLLADYILYFSLRFPRLFTTSLLAYLSRPSKPDYILDLFLFLNYSALYVNVGSVTSPTKLLTYEFISLPSSWAIESWLRWLSWSILCVENPDLFADLLSDHLLWLPSLSKCAEFSLRFYIFIFWYK